jgi:hypothetical protein
MNCRVGQRRPLKPWEHWMYIGIIAGLRLVQLGICVAAGMLIIGWWVP